MRVFCTLAVVFSLAASGCDGAFSDNEKDRVIQEAKAMGAACRHALRGLEDCYIMNRKASKAEILKGWMEMDTYMREKKIEGVMPTIAPAKPKRKDKSQEANDE